jgi:hypothetical protein
MKDFIPIFNSYFNFDRFDDSFTLSNMHNSTKAGPVGMSTQTSVIQSYEALKYLGPDLERITNSTILKPLLKWSNLALRHRNTISALFFGNKTHPSFLRKLSVVNDPEGKARIICIFDYWSQLALKEVHNWAFSQLKKIPSDRTFDQNPFSISSSNNIFYSVDLSAATDRFPSNYKNCGSLVFLLKQLPIRGNQSLSIMKFMYLGKTELLNIVSVNLWVLIHHGLYLL